METGDEVQIEGDLQSYSKAEQYLNMIKMSDKALKWKLFTILKK